MTAKELETVVARHEMQQLELKESFGAESIETACAFANAHGGFIVIGVDNNGHLANKPLRGESLRDYENRIATSTEPSVAVDAEKVEFSGADVVVLRVQENPIKPVAVKGRCYIRKGSVNHQMTPSEIAECHLKSTGGSMDAVFVEGAARDDLDMERVREYMRAAKAAGRREFSPDENPWTVLRKFQLVKSETEITRAAYLLFAKEPQIKFPQAIIHAGAFREQGALILDSCDVSGNIQGQIEQTLAFIKRNIRRAIIVSGKAEHDRYWEYPTEALREALANAVCHRDYGQANDIQVKILEDRVVISNPGQLPFDLTLDDLDDPGLVSRPRNRLIAQTFYDMHIIEHYGSGMRRMKKDCDENGSPYPAMKSGNGEFRITFSARTKESVAKLGIPPEKFGIADDTEEVAKNSETAESAQTGAESAQTGAESAQTGAESAQRMIRVEAMIDSFFTNAIRSDARRNMVATLDCLMRHPGYSAAKVAKELGLSQSAIQKIMRTLQKAGLLRREGPDFGGRWAINGLKEPPQATYADSPMPPAGGC